MNRYEVEESITAMPPVRKIDARPYDQDAEKFVLIADTAGLWITLNQEQAHALYISLGIALESVDRGVNV